MVAYAIWLLTSGSNYIIRVSDGKLLVFGMGARLQDVVAHGVSNFDHFVGDGLRL